MPTLLEEFTNITNALNDRGIDMSPEAITNRLKTMDQLWELSVNLMQAREIPTTTLISERAAKGDGITEPQARG